MGPKGSQMAKNTWVDNFGSFLALLDHFGTLTSMPCLVQNVPFLVQYGSGYIQKIRNIPKGPFWRKFLIFHAFREKIGSSGSMPGPPRSVPPDRDCLFMARG